MFQPTKILAGEKRMANCLPVRLRQSTGTAQKDRPDKDSNQKSESFSDASCERSMSAEAVKQDDCTTWIADHRFSANGWVSPIDGFGDGDE